MLTLGGSTTYNWPAVLDLNKTWSADLASLLSKKLHRPIEVINGGLNAATSVEILSQYVFKHRYLKSDVVIIHTGWNDSGPIILKDYSTTYAGYRRWGSASFELRRGEYRLLKASWLLRVVYAWWFKNSSLGAWFGFPESYMTISRASALENVNNNQPIGFEHNLDALVKLIISDGAQPILFEVPIAPASIFKLHPNRHAERIYPALVLAHKKNNQVMQKISKRYHIPLLKLPAN